MKQNKFKSFNVGPLPDGCKQCVLGHKSVIFITGHCPRRCFYCPVSDHKMYKDVMYCNERKVENIDQIVEEVKVSKSLGAGITGGDPLCALKRSCDVIRRLKKEFGKKFHIHLYTSLNLIDDKVLASLAAAGLDEFRIHPDLYDKTLWSKIAIPKGYFKRFGIEIPAIPDREKEIAELIKYAEPYVDYINLNELEASCTNASQFVTRGLNVKQLSSYAVIGSQEMALRIIKNNKPKLHIHYCTCKLKDAVQLSNRLKRRAKSIKQPHQYITTEGTLYFGEVYYKTAKQAQNEIEKIAKEHKIPQRLYKIDGKKITIAAWVLLEIKDEFTGKKLLVTQYPTADEMRVQEEELK